MINEQIRDREVRVIGADGTQLGIMSAREAFKLAQEAELDFCLLYTSRLSVADSTGHNLTDRTV